MEEFPVRGLRQLITPDKIQFSSLTKIMTKQNKLVEVARSFSYKMSLPKYENRDFFCSQKCECSEDEVEEVSKRLSEFCKQEVIKSVNAYLAEIAKEKAEKIKFDDGKTLKDQDNGIERLADLTKEENLKPF